MDRISRFNVQGSRLIGKAHSKYSSRFKVQGSRFMDRISRFRAQG